MVLFSFLMVSTILEIDFVKTFGKQRIYRIPSGKSILDNIDDFLSGKVIHGRKEINMLCPLGIFIHPWLTELIETKRLPAATMVELADSSSSS